MYLVYNSKKPYSLTVDQSYEIIKEIEGFVYVTNDKNKVQKYSRNLFTEEKVAVPQQPPVPVPPPAPVFLSEQQMINSLQFGAFDENDRVELSFRNHLNEPIIRNWQLFLNDSTISCGINQIKGINVLVSNIHNEIQVIENAIGEDLPLLREAFLTEILNQRLGVCNYIMSTNITNNENTVEFVDSVLNNNFTLLSRTTCQNPNTGREIVLWFFNNL